jgi:hypothetical protein
MTDLHDERDLEGLYGPQYKYSDHKRGDHITFRDAGRTTTGLILWVVGPGPVSKGGTPLPVHYIVEADIDASWPLTVFPGDIIQKRI